MNVFIFEGPEVTQLKKSLWRHYQIRLASGSVLNFIAPPARAKGIVFAFKAKFFPFGTWEEMPQEGFTNHNYFPLPRREILERLTGKGVAP